MKVSPVAFIDSPILRVEGQNTVFEQSVVGQAFRRLTTSLAYHKGHTFLSEAH